MSNVENIVPQVPRKKATIKFSQREMSLLSIALIAFSVLVIGFLGYRVFLGFKATRDTMIAQSNLHALHTAMQQYMLDSNGKFPDADKWMEQTAGYLSASPGTPGGRLSFLQGPADSGTVGYVYNDLASGYNLETGKNPDGKYLEPSRLVLLIERHGVPKEANEHALIPLQGNLEGEQALGKMLEFPHNADDRESATALVLYANGTIRRVIRRDFMN